MDPLTSIVLAVTIAAVFLYAVYTVVRRAVAAGIRDALGSNRAPGAVATERRHGAGTGEDQPSA